MMKNYETDDTFLARWVAGELSEEERKAFEETDAFKDFEKINTSAQNLRGPTVDTERAFKVVKAKIAAKGKPKVVKLWYAAAASVIVLLSLGVLLTANKTYQTGIGEKMMVTLPDSSTIHLNVNSSLTHQRFFWSKNKEVTFRGEGYFEISKGEGFTVQTSKGTVTVLGTQFNIIDRDIFEVKCLEGKVRFEAKNRDVNPKILTKGMLVTVNDNGLFEDTFDEDTPTWMLGKSSFYNEPFNNVLQAFKKYYPVTFELKNIDLSRRYTGSFVHDDLETALQTTFLPMGITYKKANVENTYLLSE